MKKLLISGAFPLVYADGAGRKEIPISDFKKPFIHGKIAGKTILFDGVTIHFVIMAVTDVVGNENHIGIHIGAFAVRYSLYHRLLFLLSHRQFQFVIDRANHCGKFAGKLIHRHKVIVLVPENRAGDGGTIDNHFGGHFFCRGSGRFCRCCLRFGCCCLGLCGLGFAVRNRPVVRADTPVCRWGGLPPQW